MRDRINRILDNLERVIGALLVAIMGMISYFFVNMEKLSSFKIALLFLGIVLFAIFVAVLLLIYTQELNKLDKKKE